MTDELNFVLPPPFNLNQSRLKTFDDCNRLYGWFYVEELQPIHARKPLIIGSAVHKAQVHIHLHGGTDTAVKEGTELAVEYVEKHAVPPGPTLPADEEVRKESRAMVQSLLPAYHRYWKDRGEQWKPLGQELSFRVEVGEGTNVFLVGQIDNLVIYQKGLWIIDYKTMGRLDLRDFLKYEIDVQPTAYIYGGSKELSRQAAEQGKPPVMIRGCIIDGLVKTKPPQFHREMYTRDRNDLEQFEQEFCMKAWEMAAKHAMVRGDRPAYDIYTEKMYALGSTSWKTAYPKNTQHCFRYGICSFRDLCVSDTETRRLAYRARSQDYVDDAQKGLPLRLEKP